ncbi:MAG: dolichyl-phosphate beta-glucosyltransferase [Bryobacteraceae bacterium]
MKSISIVVPAYNEESRLPATLEKILAYLDTREWDFVEVLVVDDGSRDSTAQLAESAAAKDGRIQLLRNPGNRGKGYSVRHGMLAARGAWALFTDADLSAPIEEFEKLCNTAEKARAKVAFGSRDLDRSLVGVHQPAYREKAGRAFNFVMRRLTGLPYQDTQCGFKLFEREAAREIFSRQRLERFGFDVEVLFIARVLGIPAVEVPVRWNDVAGSKVSTFAGLNGFADVLRVMRNHWRGMYK